MKIKKNGPWPAIASGKGLRAGEPSLGAGFPKRGDVSSDTSPAIVLAKLDIMWLE